MISVQPGYIEIRVSNDDWAGFREKYDALGFMYTSMRYNAEFRVVKLLCSFDLETNTFKPA